MMRKAVKALAFDQENDVPDSVSLLFDSLYQSTYDERKQHLVADLRRDL
jgi:hypothetical protein